ncbi:amidase [Bradyrhizobium sp. WYCCWR 12699]|uniref:amidase n=1 Tax=Bradyrhizobium sp. WYCCWR 12699 TaxID=3064203 RepID=UPI0028A5467F|nr:amidase [Bradyrhizobium sp. WYCCWR 12699]MDT4739902.1 amidase [Bradyrhizobium sp. WYCCWR 12699]
MAKKATKNKTAKKAATRAAAKSGARKGTVAKPVRKAATGKSAKPPRPRGPAWQWSAVETAAAIRSGAISAVETVEAHLERMRAVNPKLNAVVVDLSEEALKAAHAADKQRAKGGALGLLHGVPITIKENVDYEGRPNFNGVPANKGLVAPSDAPVVRNLKQAGAIVIGLTNTPEFSFRGFTDNPLHGLTLNPWDPDITCGGSSGGAGSAVAAGIGTIAHGNDIGGSLRWPAHCNGVATIKPTQGRIPAFNASATAERPMLAHLMSAQGPLARHVADVRLALEVMSQRDPRDPWWVPAPLVGEKPKGPIKVALAKIPADMDVDPSVSAALRQAADLVEILGGDLQHGSFLHHHGLVGDDVAPGLPDAVDVGHLDLADTVAGPFEDYPIVLAPTTVKPTPGPREDTVSAERVREIFWGEIRFISAINVLGLPGAVVPVALHDGKPIGVQLIAGRYREDLALDAAAAIEKRAGVLTRQLWEKMG